ncbi:MAG TPA: hypothetical protein VK576_08485, partial [Thermoleophilia bacterium]|nr:hypothetical protein [Thermoleophilia bacterium]
MSRALPGGRRHRTWPALRWVRRGVQLVALGLFIYLLFAAVQSREAAPKGAAYFRLDPLAGFVAMLAGRDWLPAFALAFMTVALTVALGR